MAQVNFFSPTHALLASELGVISTKNLRIVDYGCGEGELLRYLPISRINEYKGFEVNRPCIPVAREKWKLFQKIHFDYINRKKLPGLGKNNSVDAVFLVGVVQYLPDEDLHHILTEASRVLKSGGKLLISCTTDHRVYRWFNIYQLFLPHRTVNRSQLTKKLKKHGLTIDKEFERGLLLTPFFSNIFIFFFDALDKLIFKTKGELGPIGRKMRNWWAPLIQKEFSLKIDYGYTLFIVASN